MSADSEFKVLDPVDFIRINPHMYAGSSHSPIHLFKEIIDNAIDLILENKVKNVAINTFENGRFQVIDDGPGFPRIQVTLPDGTKQDSIVASLTKPHSGSKFNSDVAQHGQNGVGTMVVNALSKYIKISVRDKADKDYVFNYLFRDSKFVEMTRDKDSQAWSTLVDFQVDPQFFQTIEVNEQLILERLKLVNSCYQNCNIFYNNKLIEKDTLEKFVRGILELDPSTPIHKLEAIEGKEKISLFLTYDPFGRQAPTTIGDVNLNVCEGTYLTNVTTLFYNVAKDVIGEDKITKNDILSQFRCYCSLNIVGPRFDSQTKTRFVKNVTKLVNSLKPKLEGMLKNKFFTERFELLKEEKAVQKAAKTLKTKKVRVSADNPLKDCAKIPGKILYILEGDSAGGSLKQIRDPSSEAIYPLSGKVLNVIDKSIDKIVDSKKMKFLFEAIGIDLSKKNQMDYRYEQIKIICDADSDGLHISMLVSLILWKYAPNIIKTKRASIIMPPLYGAMKGKEFYPIYDEKNISQYESKGYNIIRFKGLGEMSPSQLEVVVRNPIEYQISPPASDKDAEIIDLCLTRVDLKRAVCEKTEQYNLKNLLTLI